MTADHTRITTERIGGLTHREGRDGWPGRMRGAPTTQEAMMTDRTCDEYLALMAERADQLLDAGETDLIKAEFDPLELNRYHTALATIARCTMQVSCAMALDDLRELLRTGSFRAAQRQYRDEMAARSEQIALQRFYHHCGVAA